MKIRLPGVKTNIGKSPGIRGFFLFSGIENLVTAEMKTIEKNNPNQ
jgi:hypothetical protein